MDTATVVATLLVLPVTLMVTYILYMSRHMRAFRKLGIPEERPWPLMGNMPFIVKLGIFQFHQRMYDLHQNDKVYGVHEPGRAVMVIKDLDMIRDISIKHFNCFVNRRHFTDEEPFGSTLTNLKGDHWRRVRNTMSPTFSSGKLKHVCPHIESCSRILLDNLQEVHVRNEAVELKETLSCYTMDVIASTGFGVQANSMRDKKSPFVTEAENFLNTSRSVMRLSIFFPFILKICGKLGKGVCNLERVKFFSDFVTKAMAGRREEVTSHKRRDFLQLLIDSERASPHSSDEEESKQLTKAEIRGLTLVFILAGYETVSTVLAFCLFLMAHHPGCLERAQKEVDQVLGDRKWPDYESSQHLTYLDACLNEAMRMFPPAFMYDRTCNEECVIQGIRIPKDMLVMFPVMFIHHDPAIWDEPKQFRPERFEAGNKACRHPFAFLPFGQGPRNCIGMRLAMLEMKIAMAALLQKMTPVPCEKSVYPVKLDRYRLKAVDGLWVKFIPRDQTTK